MRSYRKLMSLCLCAVFVFSFFLQKPLTVFAAGEVTIKAPEEGNRITDQYIVRFSIASTIVPKTVTISFRDKTGTERSETVIPKVSAEGLNSYEVLIQGLGDGENFIQVSAETEDLQLFSDRRTVKVDPVITGIMADSVSGMAPITDKNKFKNMFKINNSRMAAEHKQVPKDNAFIDRFIEVLFEEAALENIRPDIVFAQMMLETGWLGYRYAVRETQNNYGGIGATGGLERGNVFCGVREGIRVNVQHLLAYGSTQPLNGKLADPRFTLVTRGVSPGLEYLGHKENFKNGGWAMSFQYGYVIRDIMKRLADSSSDAFIVQAGAPVITEMEVSSITRSGLNIRLKDGFKPNQEIRLALSTNSDTEQRFAITHIDTGMGYTTPWSENRAAFYVPEKNGSYRIEAQIRPRGSSASSAGKTQEIQVGEVAQPLPDPDLLIIPYVGEVTLSASPYLIRRPITVTVADATADSPRINEYQVEVEHAGAKSIISTWSALKTYQFTPQTAGDYLIRVAARNKLVGGPAVQSVVKTVRVEQPKLIDAVSVSPSVLYQNRPAMVNVTPSAAPGIEAQYRLVDPSKTPSEVLSDWTAKSSLSFTPSVIGELKLKVQARQTGSDGAILDSKDLLVKILADPLPSIRSLVLSPASGIKGKLTTAGVTPFGTAGVYEYRLYVKETAGFVPLTAWSKTTQLSFTPNFSGSKTLGVKARDAVTKKEGEVKEIAYKISDASVSALGPAGYEPENPYLVGGTSVHAAGIKAKGRTLELSALAPTGIGLLYRFHVVNKATGEKTLVRDWSTSAKASWKAVLGTYALVADVKHPDSKGFYDSRTQNDLKIKSYPTVFLDPGHGGTDIGYTITKGRVNYRESDLTLSMANLVRSKLAGRGVNVSYSRSTNTTVSLDSRIQKAQSASSDLFVSLHYTKSSVTSTKGVRAYYAGIKQDPLANRYLGEGQEAAAIAAPKFAYYYTRNRGVGTDTAGLGYSIRVLKSTTMPSMQLNLGYLSNSEDMVRIASNWYRDKIAQSLADGIMQYLNSN